MRVGLFFSLGVSLEMWDRLGMLDREKLIYEKLLASGAVDEVLWFTYGVEDARYAGLLKKGITVVPMPRIFRGRLGMIVYSLCMPFVQGRYLRGVNLIKTNQMRGSWSAVIASALYRKPLLVRSGYTWSINARREKRVLSLDRIAVFAERLAYASAAAAVVSSDHDADYIRRSYGIDAGKVHVLGNYVDVDLFRPAVDAAVHVDRLAYVGRLSPEKNIANLIRAIAGLPYTLDLYFQDGALKGEMQELAEDLGSKVSFRGTVRNRDLPKVLTKYPLFVLPSLYEGMPKVLLEAMSCGVPVLGTDVQGINAVIEHGVTGWLVNGTDSVSLRAGIVAVMGNAELRAAMGAAGRRYVCDNFSLTRIADKERAVYSEVAG